MSEDEIKDKILDLMLELGQNYVPTVKQFRESRNDALYYKMLSVFGGIGAFKEKYRLCSKVEYENAVRRGQCRKDPSLNFLTEDSEALVKEIKLYIKKQNYPYMPAKPEFDADGRTDIYRRIYRVFGSIHEISGILGLPSKQEWRRNFGV
jgi:hypothetical protein